MLISLPYLSFNSIFNIFTHNSCKENKIKSLIQSFKIKLAVFSKFFIIFQIFMNKFVSGIIDINLRQFFKNYNIFNKF